MTEAASQGDAEFFKQRGFGLRIGFGERPALLVIDMLKAFTNPKMMLGANLDNEIEAIKPLLAVAHDRGKSRAAAPELRRNRLPGPAIQLQHE